MLMDSEELGNLRDNGSYSFRNAMKMHCHQFRELADSYLGNELSVEANHEINSHLERCSSCRMELESRRSVRNALQKAFFNDPANQLRSEFVERLNNQLQNQTAGSLHHFKESNNSGRRFEPAFWIALVACLLVVTVVGLQLSRLWSNRQPVSPVIATLNSDHLANLVKTELMESAVGDHRDCAVHFRLEERPIDLDQAGQKFDAAYVNLVPALIQQGNLPSGLEFVEAHSCVFEGRRFAHVVFRYHNRLVSLLMTGNGAADGKSPLASTIPPQQVISCSQFAGYRVSCFQTGQHAVFVVSDLPEGDNLSLARALSPSIAAHVTRAEQGT